MTAVEAVSIRHDYNYAEVFDLFELPFNDLIFRAQTVHRQFFDANRVQISTLLSIKTGACPEDCKYCPQSTRYDTCLEPEQLLELQRVVEEAKAAKATGATRFCMGAAWRSPKKKDLVQVTAMVTEVKALGMETCMTLGMLTAEQSQQLADAGLDYYNHNLDTSPEYYKDIVSTRTYQNRLDTLDNVRAAGMKVCCGGIVGMGEDHADRIKLLLQLANMKQHPESVPINMLVRVAGTPLEVGEDVDPFDFIRMIAVARILMPASHVRLSAGREDMNEQTQSLAFLAGANSIFYGEKLLTTTNPSTCKDMKLFQRLGIQSESYQVPNSPEAEEQDLLDKVESEQHKAKLDAFFYDAAG